MSSAARPRRSARSTYARSESPLTDEDEVLSGPPARANARKRYQDDDGEGSGYDTFDSGSEKDLDDTEDYIAPGGAAKKQKKPRIPKAKKAKTQRQAKPASAGASNANAGTRGNAAGAKRKTAATAAKVSNRSAASREDLDINQDNPLFEAVKNPESALQATVEDWVLAYQKDPAPALVELINLVLRCCGCNSSVDEAMVLDLDNVVDSLEEIQESFKKASLPSYPIVSRANAFKKFKKSLSEFFSRLIVTAAEAEVLLVGPPVEGGSEDTVNHPLIDVLKEWLSSFSSSTFRSFRHTSTYIVLNLVKATAGLAVDTRKVVDTTRKQRDAERKRAATGGGKARLKTLEERWKEEKEKEANLMEAIRDFIDSVYQHRYRDSDPLIRTDCTQELGVWIKAHPEIFMKNEYTRYLGWCLSDSSASVRLAAIQSLAQIYSRSAFPDALRHFTELFKARLVQMAVSDIEVAVRVSTMDVLVHIERRGLLEDEQRDEVGMHIFDSEARIRQEVARFLTGLIEEELEEQKSEIVGQEPATASAAQKDAKAKEQREKWETEVEKFRLKLLAARLVEYEKHLDQNVRNLGEDGDTSEGSQTANSAAHILVAEGSGRISLAIQALWSFEGKKAPLSDSAALLDLLLYDHSAEAAAHTNGSANVRNRGKKGNAGAPTSAAVGYSGSQPPNEAYRLLPAEETVLLEALVAVVTESRRLADLAKSSAAATRGDGDEQPDKERFDEMTRLFVPALPKLFAKYRTESQRVSEVLLLVPLLDLDLHASTGQANTLANLWDEVSTQFSRHSELTLLKRGAASVRALVASAHNHANLAELTTSKLTALQETLVNALREPLKGKEVAAATLDDDVVFALQANLQRLACLSGATDCCDVMEDNEDGQASSGWEIVREVALRGKLGYQGEESLVSSCLRVLALHLMWKLRAFTNMRSTASQGDREAFAKDLIAKRSEALELLEGLVNGEDGHVLQDVKGAAAARLLQIHLAFHAADQKDALAREKLAALDADPEASNLGENPERGSRAPSEESAERSLRIQVSRTAQEGCVRSVLKELRSYIDSCDADEEDAQAANEGRADPAAADDISDEEEDGNAGAERGPAGKQGKSAKSSTTQKKAGATPAVNQPRLPSKQQLEKEVETNQLVASLVSAIRFGLIDFGLSAPLIGLFGRAGHMYDVLVKLLFEVLREEGVLEGQSRKVIDVIFDGLKESFEAYLTQGTAKAEGRFVTLSRSISTALVIRGAHLAILKHIESSALVELHRRGAEYIANKWKAAERANSKSIKARSPTFWKGLGNLLVSASARDAYKIKTAMDSALQDAEIEVPPASKAWDPQRQYEKRLVTLMAKRTAASAAQALGAGAGIEKGPAPKPGPTPRRNQGGGDASERMQLDDDADDRGSLRPSPVPSDAGGYAGGPVESTPVRPAHRAAATPSKTASAKAGSARKRARAQAEDSDSEEQGSLDDESDLSDVEEDGEGEQEQEDSVDEEDSGAESDATAVPSRRGGKSNKRRKV